MDKRYDIISDMTCCYILGGSEKYAKPRKIQPEKFAVLLVVFSAQKIILAIILLQH